MNNQSADAALGHVPSGVFILTVGDGETTTGMLASWVMQAGFEPPTVSVAVNLKRYVCDWISDDHPFGLNLVGQSQNSLLKHFGKGFEPGAPAFEGLSTTTLPSGVVVLDDAIGYLECQPTSHIDSSDHRIFLAEVLGGTWQGEQPPMVHVRNSGARY